MKKTIDQTQLVYWSPTETSLMAQEKIQFGEKTTSILLVSSIISVKKKWGRNAWMVHGASGKKNNGS